MRPNQSYIQQNKSNFIYMLKITFNFAKNTVCIINLFSYIIRKGQFAIHNYSQVSWITLLHLSKSMIILSTDAEYLYLIIVLL